MPNGTKTSEDGSNILRAVVGDVFCNRELLQNSTAQCVKAAEVLISLWAGLF